MRRRAVRAPPSPSRARRPSRRCRCTARAVGTRTRMPYVEARSSASTRSREFAATPPPIRMSSIPCERAASTALRVEHVAHRLLERGGDVGHRHRLARLLARLHPAGDRGLQAGEGEVEPVPLQVASGGQPAREVDRHRGARGRRPVDVRTAGERQPEQPRDLVERLAGRVVDRRAQRLAPTVVTSSTRSSEEWPPETSSARHGSGSGPCSSWSTATWAARWFTPYSGLSSAIASALAAATPTSSAPARPGPAVTAIASTSVERDPGRLAGPLDRRHHRLEVGARGDLGHDAAEARVLLDRRGHGVGQQRLPADDADPGLVARGLDAQDERLVGHDAMMPGRVRGAGRPVPRKDEVLSRRAGTPGSGLG